jgi:hypothetical protein
MNENTNKNKNKNKNKNQNKNKNKNKGIKPKERVTIMMYAAPLMIKLNKNFRNFFFLG